MGNCLPRSRTWRSRLGRWRYPERPQAQTRRPQPRIGSSWKETRSITPRQRRLHGDDDTVRVGGKTLEQWQYELTGHARIVYATGRSSGSLERRRGLQAVRGGSRQAALVAAASRHPHAKIRFAIRSHGAHNLVRAACQHPRRVGARPRRPTDRPDSAPAGDPRRTKLQVAHRKLRQAPLLVEYK